MQLSDALALVNIADLRALAAGELDGEGLAREALLARGVMLSAGVAATDMGRRRDASRDQNPQVRCLGGGEIHFPDVGVPGKVLVFNADGARILEVDVDGDPENPVIGVLAAAASLVGDLQPASEDEIPTAPPSVLYAAISVRGDMSPSDLASILSTLGEIADDDEQGIVDVSVYPRVADLLLDAPHFDLRAVGGEARSTTESPSC